MATLRAGCGVVVAVNDYDLPGSCRDFLDHTWERTVTGACIADRDIRVRDENIARAIDCNGYRTSVRAKRRYWRCARGYCAGGKGIVAGDDHNLICLQIHLVCQAIDIVCDIHIPRSI